MDRKYDRRKFLKASLFGLGVMFVHIPSPLAASSSVSSPTMPDISLDGDLVYLQARDLFYRKKYSQAATLYRQLIAAFPNKYVYYDGYARLLGAQQKSLEVAELYREGLSRNPDHPYFMQRLALRLYDIGMGNRKAEREFCRQHGETVLFESAVVLLLQAIRAGSGNDGFYQNLQDVLNGLDKRNEQLQAVGTEAIALSDEVRADALSVLAEHYASQALRPALLSVTPAALQEESVEARLQRIDSRKRRMLYDEKEKEVFAENMQNARKHCLQEGVDQAIAQKDSIRAERYGTQLLEVDVHDTNSIGLLRRYYRKEKAYNRIVTLNRFLYLKNAVPTNALSLAHSLVRYGTTESDYAEAVELVRPLGDYSAAMNAVHAGCYFWTLAEGCARTGKLDEAEAALLQGLKHFSGRPARTYALLEHYALIQSSYGGSAALAGDLLKTVALNEALSVRPSKRTAPDNPVWGYADAYVEMARTEPPCMDECLKPLYALRKLLREGSDDYQTVQMVIDKLRMTV